MQEQLIQWQKDNHKNKNDAPKLNDYYYDLRCDAIDAGLLTLAHGEEIVRNTLKNYVKTQPAISWDAVESSNVD